METKCEMCRESYFRKRIFLKKLIFIFLTNNTVLKTNERKYSLVFFFNFIFSFMEYMQNLEICKKKKNQKLGMAYLKEFFLKVLTFLSFEKDCTVTKLNIHRYIWLGIFKFRKFWKIDTDCKSWAKRKTRKTTFKYFFSKGCKSIF